MMQKTSCVYGNTKTQLLCGSKGSQPEDVDNTVWEVSHKNMDMDSLKFNREKQFSSDLLGFKQVKGTLSPSL